MCETSAIVDHELVVAARHASDLILGRYLRVPMAKAMNLGTPRAFDRAVAELAAALRSRSAASDAEAVRSVIGILDVDWLGTTAEQRRNLIAQAMQSAGRITSAVPRTVETVFGPAADEVVDATRTAARRGQRLNIAADFNALDRRITEHLRTSQTTYVRDEYGRRNAAFGERARAIVADGLESGLGRDDIAADLQAAAEGILTGRGQFYWEVVAGSFVSQGRSFAQLSAYAEAGIDRYLIEAVLDERTTEICRFLHGKSFTVGAGPTEDPHGPLPQVAGRLPHRRRRARGRPALHRAGMTSTYDKRRLIEWLRAETARATGRRYRIDFDALDVQSLRGLVRLIRDLDHEKQAAVNRARTMPWCR